MNVRWPFSSVNAIPSNKLKIQLRNLQLQVIVILVDV